MADVLAFPREYLVIEGGCYAPDDCENELFLIALHSDDGSEPVIWTGESRQDAIRETAKFARRDGLPVYDKTARPQ